MPSDEQREIFNKLLAESDLGINDLKKTALGRGALAVAAGIKNAGGLVYNDSLHTQNLGAMLALACAYTQEVYNFQDAMKQYGKFVWNTTTSRGISRFKKIQFTSIQDRYRYSPENQIALEYIDFLLNLIKRDGTGATAYEALLQTAFEEVLKMNYYQYGLLKNKKYFCIFCCKVFRVGESGAFEIEHMWGTLPAALGRILHLFFTNCPICPDCNKKTPRDTDYKTKSVYGDMAVEVPFWHPIFEGKTLPEQETLFKFVGFNEFNFNDDCLFGRNIFRAYAIVVCGYYNYYLTGVRNPNIIRSQAPKLWTAACVKIWLGEQSERISLRTPDDRSILVPLNHHSKVFIRGIYHALRQLKHDCTFGKLTGNLECQNILDLHESLDTLSRTEEFDDLTQDTLVLSSNAGTGGQKRSRAIMNENDNDYSQAELNNQVRKGGYTHPELLDSRAMPARLYREFKGQAAQIGEQKRENEEQRREIKRLRMELQTVSQKEQEANQTIEELKRQLAERT